MSNLLPSRRIILQCSTEAGMPTLIPSDDQCEYVFVWSTPHACVASEEVGNDCKVTGTDGVIYDFSSLRRTDADYEIDTRKWCYLNNKGI